MCEINKLTFKETSDVILRTRKSKGSFNNYVDKMRGGGGQKMSVFVHAQGIKTVHAGGGVKKRQNSVHVVVE